MGDFSCLFPPRDKTGGIFGVIRFIRAPGTNMRVIPVWRMDVMCSDCISLPRGSSGSKWGRSPLSLLSGSLNGQLGISINEKLLPPQPLSPMSLNQQRRIPKGTEMSMDQVVPCVCLRSSVNSCVLFSLGSIFGVLGAPPSPTMTPLLCSNHAAQNVLDILKRTLWWFAFDSTVPSLFMRSIDWLIELLSNNLTYQLSTISTPLTSSYKPAWPSHVHPLQTEATALVV